ncbi:concanavalin A-like lectin/glucanase domain-containing protein [Hypoxylon sp. FL0890]|nr:concanavalin A-like lectin/glucanase domain-containing protein [Hypoxylon sp. FL0890]
MQSWVLTFFCSIISASLSAAFPRGEGLFGRDEDISLLSSLGGVAINIPEVKNAGGTTTALPAISNVSAEWNVPWVEYTDYGHFLRQMVGIQGSGCDGASGSPALLVGTAVYQDFAGNTSAFSWYQWYPGPMYESVRMAIYPGDQVRVIVSIETSNTGYMYVKNMRTGKEFEIDIAPDHPSNTSTHICLGGATALFAQDWEVMLDDDRQTVPVFQNVTFTNVMALDRGGKSFDLSTGTKEYVNLVSKDRQVGIPEEIDGKSFVIYSPEGKGETWNPPAKI